MDPQEYVDKLLKQFIDEINCEFASNNKSTNQQKLTEKIISQDMEKYSGLFKHSQTCLKINNTWRFANASGSAKKAGLKKTDQKNFSGAGIFNALPVLTALGATGEYISRSEEQNKKRIFFCGYIYTEQEKDIRCFQIALLEKLNKFWAFISNNQGALTTICVFTGELPTRTRGLTINEILATRRENKEINKAKDFISWKKEKKQLIMDIVRSIKNQKNERKASQKNRHTIDIISMRNVNLGHQIWNSYGGTLIACLHISRDSKRNDIRIIKDPNTNYLPVESIAERFAFKAANAVQGITVSEGRAISLNTTRPNYELFKLFFQSFNDKVTTREPLGNNNKRETKTIIFSLKAGDSSFSNEQFSIEEAILITSQTIRRLNLASPGKNNFVIDGITTPYIGEGQQGVEKDLEQRKQFKEREEFWFKKLREQLAGIELIFINGMNLMEKYPYYKAAKQFIRFGSGSYQMIWYLLKDTKERSHIAIFDFKNDPKSEARIRNAEVISEGIKIIEHTDANDTIKKIVETIE